MSNLNRKNVQEICSLWANTVIAINSFIIICCIAGFYVSERYSSAAVFSRKVPTVNLDGNLSVWNLHVILNHGGVPQALPH